MKKTPLLHLIAAAVACCALMTLVDGVLRPDYWVKSAIKLALFLIVPLVLARMHPALQLKELFRFEKKAFFTALGLGAGLYALILGAYFTLGKLFDFSAIVGSLSQNAGVTRDNFLLVSIYISFVNSLLEEFFFRGFLFANLKAMVSRAFSYGFSAALFALYHVAMLAGWFSPVLFLLVMAGLTVGGLIFNWLNEKNGTIYTSWLVHMFANFAINTIGFLLMA